MAPMFNADCPNGVPCTTFPISSIQKKARIVPMVCPARLSLFRVYKRKHGLFQWCALHDFPYFEYTKESTEGSGGSLHHITPWRDGLLRHHENILIFSVVSTVPYPQPIVVSGKNDDMTVPSDH